MRRKYMTKKQAVADWKRLYLPTIRDSEKRGTGRIDGPMRAESWNNFTDWLCKSDLISLRQYETWGHP